jgi:hypothetical protein
MTLLSAIAILLGTAAFAADTPVTIEATVPTPTPAWALLERHLIEQSSAAAIEFAARYQTPDGALIWRTTGAARFDDLPESFYNWPVLYALGGDDKLRDLSFRAWNGTLRQLDRDFGLLHREFPKALDWFHIIEGLLLFHSLALADPTDAANLDRARRYAGFYTGDDPEAPNYDAARRMIRSPVTGSLGPVLGSPEKAAPVGWSLGMASYGLPLEGLAGITRYDDLKDPANARRMGEAMQQRMMRGDVPANLAATALVTHAWLLTGDPKYAAWVKEYTGAWLDRARANGGLVPDNVGPSGKVGELHDGKWWGGHYGWRYPHGYYSIGMSLQAAAENARLVSGGDPSYLELPRATMNRILAEGRNYNGAFVVPYKKRDGGWFAFQPMDVSLLASLWSESLDPADSARIERVRRASRVDWHRATGTPFPSHGRALKPEAFDDCLHCDEYGRVDWREVVDTRTKEDRGHEAPWLRFLAGDNAGYPEEILRISLGQMAQRLRWMRENKILQVYDPRVEKATEPPDIRNADKHHWHTVNPVTTEALLQLTGGAPQQVYNGGLVQAHLRYFDPERRRPGLPPDVAALVEKVRAGEIEFQLVNVSASAARQVTVQAGMYGQDEFQKVEYSTRVDRDPDQPEHSLIAPVRTAMRSQIVNGAWFDVKLPPSTGIRVKASVRRFAMRPSYAFPARDP